MVIMVLSRRSWSPATTGPPGPSAANYVAVDGPTGPSMAAMDGPLCRKWSPGSKPEKQWLQLQIDLYNNKIILIDEFEVTIKIFRNNGHVWHVCCNSESSLAAKTTFLLTHSQVVIWATLAEERLSAVLSSR